MRITFVHPEIDNLGVEYLSAVLKEAGHQVDLILDPMLFMDQIYRIGFLNRIFSFNRIIIKKLKRSRPDLICFSVISDNYSWACKTARDIKNELDIPIVFGGIHPTSVPERVIKKDFVDYIIVGEGEQALLDLADAIESGKPTKSIRNVWSKSGSRVFRNDLRPPIQNLDDLPFPDKGIFSEIVPRFFSRYTTITSRGCPFSCSYCNNSYMKRLYQGKGRYFRRRSVDNVVEELRAAKESGFKRVIFQDETFNHDISWLREFSSKYRKEIGLPFFCWINPALVNREIVSLLKQAGCRCVEIGVQTHNQEIGRNILRRRCSEKDTDKAIHLFKEANFYITTDNMVGLPKQTEEDIIDILRFYNRNRIDFVQMYWLRYFPKTDIVGISKEQGILSESDIQRIEESFGTSFFTHQGDTFNRDLGRIVNMFYLVNILPSSVVSFLLRHRAYRFLPSKNTFSLMLLFKKPRDLFIARKKRIRINLTTNNILYHIYYYLYFISKRLLSFIRY